MYRFTQKTYRGNIMTPYILGTLSAIGLGLIHYYLTKSAYERGFDEAVDLFSESLIIFKEED